MAFNPFHRFRKHQKAFFAILTIICMFVFVLQIGFGRADPLTRLMDLFGARRFRGEYVTTLNGVKLYSSDLEQLGKRREIANTFMVGVLEQANGKVREEAMREYFSREGQQAAKDPILSPVRQRMLQRTSRPGMEDQIAEDIANLESAKKSTPAKALLYDPVIAALNFEYWQMNPGRPRNSFYFGGSKDAEDLLDFALWKQHADRLGIVLNSSDMLKALNRETGQPDFLTPSGSLLAESNSRFIKATYRDLSEAELEGALIDEFRVTMAQEALLGEPAATRGPAVTDQGVEQSPAFFSPLEFLDFFRENRTTLRVALLTVPVAKFEPLVAGAPSEKELTRLYEKYKDLEPAPDRDEPGFKELRQIRVEYVTARADSPFYQALARNRAILPTITRIGAFFNTYAAGGGVAWATAASSLPAWTKDPVLREYEIYQETVPSWITPPPAGANVMHDASFLRPQNFAALVGQIGANRLTGTPAWTNALTMTESAYGFEVRDRLRAIAASVLAGAATVASTPAIAPVTAAALAYPSTPPLPALQTVQAQLLDQASRTLAPALLHQNLGQAYNKVNELHTKPDEARKFIDGAIKDFGLEHQTMSHLQDEYAIADDPALKGLKDAYLEGAGRMQSSQLTLARTLFMNKGVYAPNLFSGQFGLVTGREELQGWEFASDPFVFWNVQDKAARVRSFAEAEKDVKAAWKRIEAQRLARKEAARIDALVRERKSSADVVPFLREQKQGPVDELKGVSLLVPSVVGSGLYQPYRPSADIIRYPRSSFVEALLTMKKPGDSVVLRDQPEDKFYVAVLLERLEPKIDNEFVDVFEKTPLRDSQLQKDFLAQRRRQFRTRLMEQLRVEAGGPLDSLGRFKIPEKLDLRRSSEPSDEG